VRGKWPETLWKQRTLDHAKYQEYLFAARDGVVARARNLRAVTQEEREVADKKEMEGVVQYIRHESGLIYPYKRFLAADA
jgi:hypothetical protein